MTWNGASVGNGCDGGDVARGLRLRRGDGHHGWRDDDRSRSLAMEAADKASRTGSSDTLVAESAAIGSDDDRPDRSGKLGHERSKWIKS